MINITTVFLNNYISQEILNSINTLQKITGGEDSNFDVNQVYCRRGGGIEDIISNSRFDKTSGSRLIQGAWTYVDSTNQKPLHLMTLLNPIEPGSNAISFDYAVGDNRRVLMSTGRLSGCSVVILKRGTRVFFAHAGADGTTQASAAERDKDMLESIVELLNRDGLDIAVNYTPEGCIDYNSTLAQLEGAQISGIIMSCNALNRIGNIRTIHYGAFACLNGFITDNRKFLLMYKKMDGTSVTESGVRIIRL